MPVRHQVIRRLAASGREISVDILSNSPWEHMEECCPFCRCLGGMHFQDASQMYNCISCDTLHDFSELERRDEEPEDEACAKKPA